MQEINIVSSVDNTLQPSLFHKSKNNKRPLLVGLHTWSYDRFNQKDYLLPYAVKNDFNLLLPEFRGPNTPENKNPSFACGSKEAVTDIYDGIKYIKSNYDIDENNIFLIGLSGGGHMALLQAAFYPTLYKSISAFVPISNLKEWSLQNEYYKNHILTCCKTEDEMIKRSPINYIKEISKANLKIFHGKFDNTVPVSQSINLYNKILNYNKDARVFLDIFDGGHQCDLNLFDNWLKSQYQADNKVEITK